MDELGTKKVALAESLSPNALLPWVSWFHVSLKTVNQEGKGTCRQGFTSPRFWNKYSVTSTILYWSKQSTRPAHIQTGRGIDSVSCWKMRHVTCRGAWMQRGVIHWRSFYNLLQTHKIFCVKKKSLRKTKESSSRDMMLWRSSIWNSLLPSVSLSTSQHWGKTRWGKQREDSCLQVRKRVFIRSWAPALRLPSFISSCEERNFCCLSCLWHCVVAAWTNAVY